jgi:DNA-binding GntR family transcriptional regulator
MSNPYKNILTPAPKHTLADDVVDSLREAIFAGRLPAGEQLSEDALAKSLNVSRGPIREALSQLEHDGLIITRNNRRKFVARLSREDLDEVYSVRSALELLAVQEAVHHAGPAELAELQAIVDEMMAYAKVGITEKQAAETDVKFHKALCRASAHKRLYKIWTDLQQQVHVLLLSRNVANMDFRDHAVSSHQSIVDAIREKDEARAISLMQTHLQASYSRIVSNYEQSVLDDSENPSLITRSISDANN